MWYEVEVSSQITVAVEADSEDQAKELAKEEASSGMEAMTLFTEEFRLEVESVTEIDESKKDNCDIVAE
ncbi:MAG: hypothetical protein IJQ18_08735 [Paludibacteraceae bacterium]|nr:hypothetical protein [Paludibacteraceae bacterium]